MLKVFYHHTKFGGAKTLHTTGASKKCKRFLFVCLCVCVSFTVLNNRDCAHDFA